MAYIQKRNGKYRIRYRSPEGQTLSQTFTRLADAQKFASTVEADKARGDWIDPRLAKTTFAEYVEGWVVSTAHLRAGTRVNIEGRLRNHLLPAFGKKRMGSIQASHVRGWLSEMSAKGLSAGTIRAAYGLLARIMRTAEIDGVVRRTPCVGISLPKDKGREEMRFLEPEQIAALANAIDERYAALVYTAAYSGMRYGELAALKVKNVNLLRGSIDVVESLSEVKGERVEGPTKTGKRRSVVIPRFLATMLGEHVGRFPSNDGRVFSAAGGGALQRNNFYRRHYKPAVVRAGLDPGLRFHDLRHTCASLLIAQNAHPKEIQEHLGHSTIRLTFDRYGHLFPQLTERLRDGLEEAYRAGASAATAPSRAHLAPIAGSVTPG